MSLNQIINATKTITTLPNIASPPAAPDLSAHISSSKTFANQWIQNQAGQLSDGVQSVGAMSNNWNNAYKHQMELLENNPDNRPQIKSILQTLSQQSKNTRAIFDGLKGQIANDSKDVAALASDLNGDATRIQAKISGDEAAIQALQNQIAKAQAKINDYHSRDWMWWIPVAGWIERAVESLADNIAGARASINHLHGEEGQLNADLNSLKAITSSVSAWVSAMQLLAQSMGTIGTSVDNVDADINNLISAIDGIDVTTYPIWVKAQVNSLNDQMDVLSSVVNALNS